MKDLADPFWIKVKGWLFLIIGVVAAVCLFAQDPGWRTAILLVLVIWGFCRFYYFAFYVIEKYVDSKYKFSGLISFVRYWLEKRPK